MEKKFTKYAEILIEWNKNMNLVAPSTINDIGTRHISDSMQLAEFLPMGAQVCDLGSGAGFPGVVLAVMGFSVVCIESIGKKAGFLNELKKELDLPNLRVVNDRVENFVKTPAFSYENTIFTARAFAPLVRIFDWTYTKRASDAGFLLLKGRGVMDEIALAQQKYKFDYQLIPSKTGDGFVVKINNLKIL